MNRISNEKKHLILPDAEVIYIPEFYSFEKERYYFKVLKTTVKWQQDNIKVFGKIHKQPRLTALYGENNQTYSYSNIEMKPKPFIKVLQEIKNDIENITKHDFTTVLLNLYRDGNDSNGWHADNEKELGKNPVIASLSLGEARWFHFKHRVISNEKYKLLLEPGSLLVMKGRMQHHWLHQIPKTKKVIDERINLTFRKIEIV
ncbi:alpha-ketoglutarate-dependent dioxygenase AlkB family protein [Geojedonia litorea]|uniref:Alpha-ketoglutarate-dependent dioxygenase AlkB family protein n=1 Tax=Geojedonia litorea TaxID=1268269 RepID=A0ABV9N247_9FLAO